MRILVATDGSEFGDAALNTACRLAGSQTAPEVYVLTAYKIPAPVMTEPFVPVPVCSQEEIGALRDEAEQIALTAEKQLKFKCPDATVTSGVMMDDPGAAIIASAKKWNADIIVVGSHGQGFLGRVLLGSVSDYVVHHAPCSVLVARKPSSENGHRH